MGPGQRYDGRRFERFEILDYAMVNSPTCGDPFRSVIVDIGLGGLQLRSKEQLPVGETCELHIGRNGGEPLIVQGEVRYSRITDESGLFSSGFKFLPKSHEERASIAEYVHSVFMRQGEAIEDHQKKSA
jgi:hypothetical protein